MHIYIDDNSNPMKEFQIAAGFWPELSRTNPFLSDEGSQSIPLTLPASDHNMRLIGYVNRITPKYRPPKKINAIFSADSVWMRGTLYLEQANRKDGIQCTFYTNEGQLYEKIKDYKLSDLDWPVYKGVGSDYATKAKYWMNKFINIMTGQEYGTNEYCVFSVMTDSNFIIENQKDVDYKLMLNETNGTSPLSFLAMQPRYYYMESGTDATKYTAPVGYGVTPFLRVGYILRHIMEYFGYTLDSNIFDTDVSLQRLVLLNNTADAITNGDLSFKQLLPDDIEVEDLISFIRYKFGVEFAQIGNHVQIRSWNQAINTAPDMDLSAYIADEPTFVFEDKSAIALSYSLITGETDTMFQTPTELTHEPPAGYTKVDRSTNDKIPTYKNDISGYMNLNYEYSAYARVPHIGGVKNLNTELKLSDSSEDSIEDENAQLPIMVCFAMPGLQTDKNSYKDYQYYTGTIFSFDTLNKKWGTYSLVANESPWELINPVFKLEDNLYNKCYEVYDSMLQYANQQIECEAIMPPYVITTMDITIPKILKGQKVLLERIDYVLGQPDLCRITARTLHQFND